MLFNALDLNVVFLHIIQAVNMLGPKTDYSEVFNGMRAKIGLQSETGWTMYKASKEYKMPQNTVYFSSSSRSA
jgi:hypothetical protein